MTNKTQLPEGFTEQDIFFECPKCGKSLGIDQRGAGLVVACTDCGTKMKVPVPDFSLRPDPAPGFMTTADYTEAAELTGTSASARSAIGRLKVEMEDMGRRKQHLEQARMESLDRFEKISEEMAVIQSSIDRVVDLLQEVGMFEPLEAESER
ncbi:MAG: hypothetical protein U1E27_08880 [Kiritimatiellia bacterium]|nr:hypothetical protein [Kiritimatiellia bacterium]